MKEDSAELLTSHTVQEEVDSAVQIKEHSHSGYDQINVSTAFQGS